ncbi:phytoene desaturase family protein [Cryptosporangium minutisporangium]|uniref:phytoene desaturase family protein n=1 Tax=Cryptosporangium minutisporangium TaxID=113569 RepID=UPI0031F0E7DA
MADVVVVGAGIGGLTAAVRLAVGGHRVTVCERAPEVGGKLGLLTRDGFRFDTGPSLVTMPQVFADFFRETGDRLETVLDLQPLDPIAHYRFGDGTTLESCADPFEFRRRVDDAFGGGAGADWAAFWKRAERIWAATYEPFLASALDGPRTLARYATRLRDLAAIAPGRSLRGMATAYLRDPRLRQFVERYATYTGSDPRRAPAALASVPYAELAFGGWYLRGGLRRLADALLARCAEHGVAVRTGTEVTRITADARGVTGVLLADGGRLPADVVVANADATHVYQDLIAVPSAARALRRTTPSLSGFVLLLGVRGRTPGLAHHTVLFPPGELPGSYDAEFDHVFGDPGRPVPDPTLYLSVPDDPAVRPEGHEAWFVLVNAARQGTGRGAVDWRTPGLADRYADLLLQRLAERGYDPGDRLLFREVRTPADLEARTHAVGGAIYGTSSNGARAAFLRPGNRSVVPGLFLVGGSSHPGGGLPLVTLSAQTVAGLVGPA